MYPYQYPMYPFNPMMCGNCSMPYSYPGYPEDENSYRSSEPEDFDPSQEQRGEAPASMKTPVQPGMGNSSLFPSGMPMMPGMMTPTGTMQPDMMAQLNTLPDIMAQLNALQQSTFTAVLRQIQIETPQIISSLIAIGASIEALRQIILRIIEAANKDQQPTM